MAERHLRSLKRVPRVEVTALCDLDVVRAERTAARYGVPYVFCSLEEMLATRRPDVVHVTTPPMSHGTLAREALLGDCHVLIEKPAAMSCAELAALDEAAAGTGRAYCAVHNILFEPAMVKARALMAAGIIGTVLSVHFSDCASKAELAWLDAEHWCHNLPCGMFGEMLPHPLYSVAHIIEGAEISCVRALKNDARSHDPFDEMVVLVAGEASCATVSLSLNAAREEMTMVVFGTRGQLVIDVTRGLVSVQRPEIHTGLVRRGFSIVAESLEAITQTAQAAMLKGMKRRPTGHLALMREFYRSLSYGTPPPVSPEEMWAVTRLYEATITTMDPVNRTP